MSEEREDADRSGVAAIQAIEADVRALMRGAAQAAHDLRAADARGRDEKRRLLLGGADVLDAFDRVFRSVAGRPDAVTPQMNVWLGNFRAVRRLLERLLRDEGLARIETVAGDFDPRWHVVAETIADPARASGAIVEEVKAGYLWRDEVLRKSEVVVVRNE